MLIGHKKQWNFLKNKLEKGQISHAYLFTGDNQTGKKTFAKEFAKLAVCQGKGSKPCTECFSCRQADKNNFPDIMFVEPEDGKEISIAKIREVQNFLSLRPYYGTFKIVIVDQAEKMNQEAQSCFLKTLEEPKGQAIIMLVSSMPEMILETIHSRCQEMKFFAASEKDVKDFLETKGADKRTAQSLAALCQGRPGRALELFLNPDKAKEEKELLAKLAAVIPADLAEKFKYVKELEPEQATLSKILEALQRYFRHLMLLKTGVLPQGDNDYFPRSQYLEKYPVEKLKDAIKLIEDINFQALFTNASPKLALEMLLMEI